jgi:hypothetical protein
LTDINTPDAVLLETTALMRFDRNSGSEVSYFIDKDGHLAADGADDGAYPRAVHLSTPAWLEMGRPDIVTVSVRPGDALNAARADEAGPVLQFFAKALGFLTGLVVILICAGIVSVLGIGLIVLLQNLLAALGTS